MIDKLQNFMKWAKEQVFKTNPPKEQHMEHVQVVEEKPVKKPRKKKETPNVTN
jgi:hypothetical protein